MWSIVPSGLAILMATVYLFYLLFAPRQKDLSCCALLGGLAAAAALEFFDLRTTLQPAQKFYWQQWSLLSTALLPLFWLVFALTFSRARGLSRLPPVPRFLLFVAPLLPCVVLLNPLEFFLRPTGYRDETVLMVTRPGYFFCILLVLYLTYALMQLERTLLALPRHARWQGKFEAIGAGTLLTMYLVYFSQGLLYSSLDHHLLPARGVALAAAVTLMAFSRFRRGETARMQISPALAYRSLVALAIGVYLFGLGLLGEGLRTVDPALQHMLMPIAGLLGGIAVITVFLSETMRRRIKVSLHKNFYRDKYDYREQWLRFTRHVDSACSREELQQAILAIFGEAFAVAATVLYLRDPDGDICRAAAAQNIRLPADTFSSDSALLRYLAGNGWVFSARDENPQVWQENRTFLEEHNVSFIVPLHADRLLEGFVLLGHPVNPREEYTYEDFDLMKLLAAQAASAIRGRRLTDQLAATRELAAIGKVSAFVLHDLKNLVSSFALVVDNARRCLNDESFRTDMLLTLDDNVSRMRALISRLQNLEEKPTLDLQPGDLAAVVCDGARQAGMIGCEIIGGPVAARFDTEEMGKVALNLLLNAREAGSSRVWVEVGTNDRPYFRVRDAGCGMSEEFIRHRLFRPFETTKKQGFGIGLYQCKQIVEAHGGTIEVSSTPGCGSEFTVWLPTATTAPGFCTAESEKTGCLDSYSPPATFHEGILKT